MPWLEGGPVAGRLARTWLLSLLLLAAVVPGERGYAQGGPNGTGDAATVEVVVTLVSNGWHTGLALPPNLAGRLQAARDFPADSWLEIGFGDEAFYRDPDPGLATLLRAALQDSPAVLHVFAFTRAPRSTFPRAELRDIELAPAQAEALLGFIDGAFVRARSGGLVDRGKGLYRSSRFYQANGSFTLGHSCNTWAAEALEAAGLPISSAGVVTAEDLLRQLRLRSGTAAEHD